MGRYLVCGADVASLYLEVEAVEGTCVCVCVRACVCVDRCGTCGRPVSLLLPSTLVSPLPLPFLPSTVSPSPMCPTGTEVTCVAQNDAVLEGLLTVFHVERSSDTEVLENVQVGVDGGEGPGNVD